MKFRRSHELGLDEARRRADKLAEFLRQQYSLTSKWRGDYLVVSGNGVNGHMLVAEESIEMVIKLGFALKLMEGPIRSFIENALDEQLS